MGDLEVPPGSGEGSVSATPAAVPPPGQENLRALRIAAVLIDLAFLARALLFYFLLEAAARQTLGQRLLGPRVLGAAGTRPTVWAVALRYPRGEDVSCASWV
jgi:uncharacterized RDD family membrane protein YckC